MILQAKHRDCPDHAMYAVDVPFVDSKAILLKVSFTWYRLIFPMCIHI